MLNLPILTRHLTFAVAGLAISCATFSPAMANRKPAAIVEIANNATPQQACANLRQVKLGPPATSVTDFSEYDRLHADIRGSRLPFKPDAEEFLRMSVSGGMTSTGPGGPESVFAWRDQSGTWQVSRAYIAGPHPPPPPEYPYAPVWPLPTDFVERSGIFEPEASSPETSIGTLTTEQGAALEALLDAPCLAEEPQTIPAEFQIRGGGTSYCPPDSIYWSLEWRKAGSARFYSRPCRLLGPVGAIVRTLQQAKLTSNTPAVVRRADIYPFDYEPKLANLQAALVGLLPGATFKSEAIQPAKIIGYMPGEGCDGALLLQSADGVEQTIKRDWSLVDGFQSWPKDATHILYFPDLPEAIVFPGTTRALLASGVLAAFRPFCQSDE